jgi:hypothetical protein
MHDASCNFKNIQLHNATITCEGIKPFKLPIAAQVSYKKRFSENNAYMMQLRSQVALQSQMSFHKKHQSLQTIKVGCDSSRIHLQKR